MTDDQAREVRKLRWRAVGVLSILSLVTLLILFSLWRAFPVDESPSDRVLIGICVLAAGLGSAISALLSAADRISHGWELTDGTKLPERGRPDKFVARMIPLFLLRPLFGATMGFLVYSGIVGGYLITVRNADNKAFSPQGLAFLAALGGLFAKTLLEKLKVMFKALLGAEEGPRADQKAEASPAPAPKRG